MWRPTDAFNFFKLLVPSGIPNDGKVMYPKLYRLSIVGMNLEGSFGYRTAIFPYLNFANLRHLALYSLSQLRPSTQTVSQKQRLRQRRKSPNIRYGTLRIHLQVRDTTPEGKIQLSSFIRSFSGLETLSVLLEHTREMIDPACFLDQHGKTLKVLV
jgi:hypothetical protein